LGIGIGTYVSALINGFSFPFGFSIIPIGASPSASVKRKNNRNLNMSFIPFPDVNGNIAGHLTFRMSY
jgi:hypothetical protein